MIKMLLGKREVADQEGRTFRFSYYRVQTRTGYGVCIKDQDGKSATVTGITTEVRRINTLLRLLMEGGVSPVSLRDVVEDWLIA